MATSKRPRDFTSCIYRAFRILSRQLSPTFSIGLDYFYSADMGEHAMAERKIEEAAPMRFGSILRFDVPKGRDGKHKQIITQLLSDLEQLAAGLALKIPLSELPDSKENIRSALNRATRQRGMEVATSSDDEFLYVWNVQPAAGV